MIPIFVIYILGFYFTAIIMSRTIKKESYKSSLDDIDKEGVFVFALIWPASLCVLFVILVIPVIYNVVMWPIKKWS